MGKVKSIPNKYSRASPTGVRNILDHEFVNLDLHGLNLGAEFTSIVGVDGNGDDRTGNTSGTAKSHLAGNENVLNLVSTSVLVI